MRYSSRRRRTVKHSLVSREVTWGEEYLQVDEWKVRGEEEQVVLTHFITLSKFSSFSEAGIKVVRLA